MSTRTCPSASGSASGMMFGQPTRPQSGGTCSGTTFSCNEPLTAPSVGPLERASRTARPANITSRPELSLNASGSWTSTMVLLPARAIGQTIRRCGSRQALSPSATADYVALWDAEVDADTRSFDVNARTEPTSQSLSSSIACDAKTSAPSGTPLRRRARPAAAR